ncbi:MAG TPA: AraC family transcriptional regulator [Rhizobiaceae bacterium]|nr:AraC family transcriptional regulator [Rhizobiaceae bacterium]
MTELANVFSPLLQRPPVLSSCDVDEVRTLLRASHDRFEAAPSRWDKFFLRIHGVKAGAATLALVRSGAPVQTRQNGSLEAYTILLPLRGAAELTTGGKKVICDPQHAALSPPGCEQWISAERNCDRLWLSIGQAAVTRIVTSLLGEALTAPIIFEPTIDLGTRSSRSLFNAIAFASEELSSNDSPFYNPMLRKDLEELIVTTLVLTQKHNHDDRFAGGNRFVSPRDVRRVVDYMHANLHASISLEDLVVVSGVPGRTLRHHFHMFFGMSPLSYLRQIRFARARSELLSGDGGLRVTDVATRYGFEHLGRFSAGYRQRYGECPSETVAARRRFYSLSRK